MKKRLFKKGVREGKKSGDQAPLSHLNASDSWRMLESRHMRGMWEQRGGGKQDGCQSGALGQLTFHVFVEGCRWLRVMWPACRAFMCNFERGRERFFGSQDCCGVRSPGRKGGTEKVGGTSSGKPFQLYQKMCLNILNYSQRWYLCQGWSFLLCQTKKKQDISNVFGLCSGSKNPLTAFVVSVVCFSFSLCRSSVGSALPRRRCCAYITIGMICIFIGVGLTVSTISVLYVF